MIDTDTLAQDVYIAFTEQWNVLLPGVTLIKADQARRNRRMRRLEPYIAARIEMTPAFARALDVPKTYGQVARILGGSLAQTFGKVQAKWRPLLVTAPPTIRVEDTEEGQVITCRMEVEEARA